MNFHTSHITSTLFTNELKLFIVKIMYILMKQTQITESETNSAKRQKSTKSTCTMYYLSGTSRVPKVKGVRDLKSSKYWPLKSENSLFIAFSYYNFKKSGGSADPADPVLAGSLIWKKCKIDFYPLFYSNAMTKYKRSRDPASTGSEGSADPPDFLKL